MESYFAILDQNPSALSVLQAPVDGNNDSVIKFFGGGVLVHARVNCEHFSDPTL